MRLYSEEETNEIMAGMDEVYAEEEKRIASTAPRCHNRPMILMEDDLDDGVVSSEWFECEFCGHTKEI